MAHRAPLCIRAVAKRSKSWSATTALVSDFGFGAWKPRCSAQTRFMESNAKKCADRFGVGFGREHLLALWASFEPPRRRLPCGRECVCAGRDLGDHQQLGRKERRDNAELPGRARQEFSGSTVTKREELGAATPDGCGAQRRHAVEPQEGRLRVGCPYKTRLPTSMMFSDLAQRRRRLFAEPVVKSISASGEQRRAAR